MYSAGEDIFIKAVEEKGCASKVVSKIKMPNKFSREILNERAFTDLVSSNDLDFYYAERDD